MKSGHPTHGSLGFFSSQDDSSQINLYDLPTNLPPIVFYAHAQEFIEIIESIFIFVHASVFARASEVVCEAKIPFAKSKRFSSFGVQKTRFCDTSFFEHAVGIAIWRAFNNVITSDMLNSC